MCVIDVSVKGKNVYNLKAFQLRSPRERCSILLFLNISISSYCQNFIYSNLGDVSGFVVVVFRKD